MTTLADTQLDGFDFIGEPFDPRPSVPRERPVQVTARATLSGRVFPRARRDGPPDSTATPSSP